MRPFADRLRQNGNRRRTWGGFTVLEMVVAVAVVGVLFSIAIPSFNRLRNQARAEQCASNLRGLAASLNMYLGDHNLMMPTMVAARNSVEDDEPALDTVLEPYVPDPAVFRCSQDHERIWETTGTSYLWNSLVNGQPVGSLKLLELTENQAGIPLMSDKENFHKHIGDEVNVLYADGHVTRQVQFAGN